MGTKEIAVEILKNTASMMSETVTQKAASSLSTVSKSSEPIKLPLLTDDENVLKYVKELQLDDPKNMVEFLTKGWFAQFECIMDAVNETKEIDLINSRSLIDGAQRHYKRAVRNESIFSDELKAAMDKLDEGLPQLEGKALYYINQIRAIDNRPKLSFFVRSKLDINKVDTYNHCAKAAIEWVMNGYNLLFTIESALNLNTQDTVDNLENFESKVLAGDNCSLMDAYDDKRDQEFWTTLSDKLERILDNSELLTDFMSSEDNDEQQQIDYDNIDFS